MEGERRATPYGPFPVDYLECPLIDLCAPEGGVQTGPFGSQLHKRDYVEVGTPIITVEHLGDNRILHDATPKVSDADRGRLSRYQLRPGDIVFSRVGSVDRRALVSEEEAGWLFSGRCLRVRPNPELIDPTYLSYFFGLETFKEYVRSIAVGATMPSINTAILSNVPVIFPQSIHEQQAIASILKALDDKIELNWRMSETWEAMARALFEAWFVDFQPVRQIGGGPASGLPLRLEPLGPRPFEGSERGAIPRGWTLKPFGELLADTIGGDWGKESPNENNSEPVAIIRGTDIPNIRKGGVGNVPVRYTTPRKLDRRKLRDGDIIVEVSGGSPKQPTGRSLRVTKTLLDRFSTDVVCASFCRRFRPMSLASGLLASQHLDRLYETGGTWAYQNQSTGIANFQTNHFLENELVVWPGEQLLEEYFRLVEPLLLRSTLNESMILTEIRDTLLPKLISGELRISEAEQWVSEVV